jgi:hypothetical protein
MFVKLMELGIIIMFVVMGYTQLIFPIYHGRKIFPWIRNEGKLKVELIEITQAAHEQNIAEAIEIGRKFATARAAAHNKEQGGSDVDTTV